MTTLVKGLGIIVWIYNLDCCFTVGSAVVQKGCQQFSHCLWLTIFFFVGGWMLAANYHYLNLWRSSPVVGFFGYLSLIWSAALGIEVERES